MWGLKKELETRKENLIFLLKNKKDFLEIEKQHQLYGAIKEIDHIINLMDQYREEDLVQKTEQTTMIVAGEDGAQEEVTAKKVSEKTLKFKIPIKFKFSRNDDA